jgi:hypothetical protein
VKDHPQVAQYAVDLGGSHCNLGNVFLVHRRDPAAALPFYDKAITGLCAVLAAQPKLASARTFLRNSYEGRYQALRLLGRTDDALADVDRLFELGNTSPLALLGRFEVLFGTDTVRALAELDRLAAEPSTPHETLYYAAVLLCEIAAQCDPEERDAYRARAVALLEQLLRRGHFVRSEAREQLEADPRIEDLRDREDFRGLCERVARAAAQAAEATARPVDAAARKR